VAGAGLNGGTVILTFANEPEAKAFLKEALSDQFEVFPEVSVRHATFSHVNIRPDFVAVPKDNQFSDLALAFEVKSMSKPTTPAVAKALKQASDYVLARINHDPKRADGLNNHAEKPVVACFLFPAPEWRTEGALHGVHDPDELRRIGDQIFLSGMAHLAGYLRVGLAFVSEAHRKRSLVLTFGPNEIWVSSRGWRSKARDRLVGKRQIGSTRKNLADLLEL
jgi:hypothetical protein